MKVKMILWAAVILLSAGNISLYASEPVREDAPCGAEVSKRFIHRVGIDYRPSYVVQTNDFLKGYNQKDKPIKSSHSVHLKYSFQFAPDTYSYKIYAGAYQGVGMSYHTFGNSKELGAPFALYLFQGARIAGISPSLSFNYEWNFGLSAGWSPHDYDTNPYNVIVGSKLNAYINANFYFNWMVSRRLDLAAGISVSHFSNGNTKLPNGGVNTVGLRVGMVYNFDRKNGYMPKSLCSPRERVFDRHMSYDLVLFGSWRRTMLISGETEYPAPGAYKVLGFNISPMYNLSHKIRLGLSVDGMYDGSANIMLDEYSGEIVKPPFSAQMALGMSGRVEYVMPYFTVGFGMGVNIIHRGGDLKSFYQVLALKMEITRNSFLHIGYSLREFQAPNFLMLGFGYRFNNKRPGW